VPRLLRLNGLQLHVDARHLLVTRQLVGALRRLLRRLHGAQKAAAEYAGTALPAKTDGHFATPHQNGVCGAALLPGATSITTLLMNCARLAALACTRDTMK
jgi:hypothetical protein